MAVIMMGKKAAVLFNNNESVDGLFADFVKKITASGITVGGIVQEMHSTKHGKMGSIDAIEVDTAKRINIKTPHLPTTTPGTCLLDASMLAECSSAIHRAINGNFDLVVIEKFGRQEAKGEGLIDEIMAALASDTPAIIALPEGYKNEWDKITGGEIEILPANIDAMVAWWNNKKPAP
ncbi:MAG: DUF2478 domain-containing protein [Rhodospirillaceae bacterium]|nr:DUF2478 domain-containing protein [Rhodospirillaceae bacterium]